MELTRLKANSQYRPCVDEKPYFSWVLTSEKKNVMQTSYHITVTDPCLLYTSPSPRDT